MTIRRDTTRRISAPLPEVFAAICDARHIRSVSPSILRIDVLSEVTKGEGLLFRETRKMGKNESSTTIKTTEYALNSHVRMVSDEGGTIWDTLFTVRETEDGSTQLHTEMEARPYKFMPKLILPVIIGMIAKFVEADMDAVKTYCEAGKAASPQIGN